MCVWQESQRRMEELQKEQQAAEQQRIQMQRHETTMANQSLIADRWLNA